MVKKATRPTMGLISEINKIVEPVTSKIQASDGAGIESIDGNSDSKAPTKVCIASGSYLYAYNDTDNAWHRVRCDSDKHLLTAKSTFENSVSGTTTDSYQNALVWNCSPYLYKTIFIKNTGSNDMDYRVFTEVYAGGIQYLETSGTLAPDDVAKVVLNNLYTRIIIQVRSSTAGNSTTYQIDYIGMKG